MEDVKEVRVSSKNLKGRIIIFIVCVIVAITSFSIGIHNWLKKESGEYILKIKQDENYLLAENEFTTKYYFEGTSSEIKQQSNEISEFYDKNMKYIYSLLDCEKTYDDVINIAYINKHLGKQITVTKELYDILLDAYDRTNNSLNYSMFANPLYKEWERLFSYEETDKQSNDPLYNDDEKQFLEKLSSLINNNDNFILDIIDSEKHIIKFDISNEYKEFIKEHGLLDKIIDLNVLKTPYEMDYMKKQFIKNNYLSGYMYNENMLLTLSNSTNLQYYLYDYQKPYLCKYASIDVKPSYIISQRKIFPMSEDEKTQFYSLDYDNNTLYRSLSLNINTGYGSNSFMICNVCSDSLTAVEIAFINNELLCFTSTQQIKQYIDEKQINASVIVCENNTNKQTIAINCSSIDITIYENTKYQLINS